MKYYDINNNGNEFSIVTNGNVIINNNTVVDCVGNLDFGKTYKENVLSGLIGSKQCFEFLKSGGVIENVSTSPCIEIIDNVPVWKIGIESELLNNLNDSVKQNRAARYSSECGKLNEEISRKEFIGDISIEEKTILVDILIVNSNLIKTELPYFNEVILL